MKLNTSNNYKHNSCSKSNRKRNRIVTFRERSFTFNRNIKNRHHLYKVSNNKRQNHQAIIQRSNMRNKRFKASIIKYIRNALRYSINIGLIKSWKISWDHIKTAVISSRTTNRQGNHREQQQTPQITEPHSLPTKSPSKVFKQANTIYP